MLTVFEFMNFTEPILSNSSFHMEAAGIANNNTGCDSFLDSPQLESTSIEEVNDDYDIGIDLLNEADEEYDTEMSLIVDEIMGTGDKVNVDIISNVTKFKPKVLKVSSGSVEDSEEIVDQISNKKQKEKAKIKSNCNNNNNLNSDINTSCSSSISARDMGNKNKQ